MNILCDEPYFIDNSKDLFCPEECPFISFNDVWKCIGICTIKENCSLYNPLLNFADEESNKCLPCLVSGCIRCIKSDIKENSKFLLNIRNNLPNICLECMSGYKLSNDKTKCNLIYEEIIIKCCSFFLLFFLLFVLFFIVYFYKNPHKINFFLFKLAFQHRTLSKFRNNKKYGNPLYPLNLKLSKIDIAGVGLMLYFRFLTFLSFLSVTFIIVCLFEVYLPFSKLIQIYRNIESTTSFENCSYLKKYISLKISRLIDIKSLDWMTLDMFNIITRFKENTIITSFIRYMICMIATFSFLYNQKKFSNYKLNISQQMMNFALFISNFPSHISEEDIKIFFEKLLKKKIIGVSLCYDFYKKKKIIFKLIEEQIEWADIKVKLHQNYEEWIEENQKDSSYDKNTHSHINNFLLENKKKKRNFKNRNSYDERIGNKHLIGKLRNFNHEKNNKEIIHKTNQLLYFNNEDIYESNNRNYKNFIESNNKRDKKNPYSEDNNLNITQHSPYYNNNFKSHIINKNKKNFFTIEIPRFIISKKNISNLDIFSHKCSKVSVKDDFFKAISSKIVNSDSLKKTSAHVNNNINYKEEKTPFFNNKITNKLKENKKTSIFCYLKKKKENNLIKKKKKTNLKKKFEPFYMSSEESLFFKKDFSKDMKTVCNLKSCGKAFVVFNNIEDLNLAYDLINEYKIKKKNKKYILSDLFLLSFLKKIFSKKKEKKKNTFSYELLPYFYNNKRIHNNNVSMNNEKDNRKKKKIGKQKEKEKEKIQNVLSEFFKKFNIEGTNFQVRKCNVEPIDIKWQNIGNHTPIIILMKIIIVIIFLFFIIIMWSIIFYGPYAIFALHHASIIEKPKKHEVLFNVIISIVLGIFIGFGNLLVTFLTTLVGEFMKFQKKQSTEAFVFCINSIFQQFNFLLNVLITHLTNAGGDNKIRSFYSSKFFNHFKLQNIVLGEEYSFCQSLNYNILPFISFFPTFFSIFGVYIFPFIYKSVRILFFPKTTIKKAEQLIQCPECNLHYRYSEIVISFTTTLLLFFFTHNKYSTSFTFLLLFLSYLFIKYRDTYLFLRETKVTYYYSTFLFDTVMIFWSIPTGILSILPFYWLWRSYSISILILPLIFFFHTLIYFLFYNVINISLNKKKKVNNITYKNLAEIKPYNWFNTNPVYVLKQYTKRQNEKYYHVDDTKEKKLIKIKLESTIFKNEYKEESKKKKYFFLDSLKSIFFNENTQNKEKITTNKKEKLYVKNKKSYKHLINKNEKIYEEIENIFEKRNIFKNYCDTISYTKNSEVESNEIKNNYYYENNLKNNDFDVGEDIYEYEDECNEETDENEDEWNEETDENENEDKVTNECEDVGYKADKYKDEGDKETDENEDEWNEETYENENEDNVTNECEDERNKEADEYKDDCRSKNVEKDINDKKEKDEYEKYIYQNYKKKNNKKKKDYIPDDLNLKISMKNIKKNAFDSNFSQSKNIKKLMFHKIHTEPISSRKKKKDLQHNFRTSKTIQRKYNKKEKDINLSLQTKKKTADLIYYETGKEYLQGVQFCHYTNDYNELYDFLYRIYDTLSSNAHKIKIFRNLKKKKNEFSLI
ncbi:hypothetical protein PGAL8A_00523100 [Plasmodium gallinaceum]|uniref:Uncharacterized protein n=1 Tax=Plasmodium gallinaceum TaxID=5849 RepID=A0A1J1GZC9_PLAGA|nr:hypothetical protein PGAL8A_00523100 [Plasmodium gallinaceum]CRG97655.1 hypothetical protein PGAL8A_00523100 [Plasmodium gallinaceum]